MTSQLTRRGVLAGALAGMGQAALARAPQVTPRPVARGAAPVILRPDAAAAAVSRAGLSGNVAYVLADAASGEILTERLGDLPLPPASTLKTVTTLYALDRLGEAHRYRTQILATGPLVGGTVEGDIVLFGSGDPTLDTDRMKTLAGLVAGAGVTGCTGRFLLWAGALPQMERIDDSQPEHVGYNPAIGGLNLNYNRVHFSWEKTADGYDTEMLARGETAAPETQVARMSVVDRKGPVYDYRLGPSTDYWSVAEGALGKGGSRWLPVRHPALYAGDVFRALARDAGVSLPRAEIVTEAPSGFPVAEVTGPVLPTLLKSMLKYSTNLTAEVTGLTASLVNGVPVNDLLASGSRMAGWAVERYGIEKPTFRDHSGLGYDSRVAATDMVRILAGGQDAGLPGLLKSVNLALDNSNPAPSGVSAVAKTGTLNFVSCLVGYLDAGGSGRKVFAILTADTERRDAVPMEQRDRPDGGRAWAQRSRVLQKQLLRIWGTEGA